MGRLSFDPDEIKQLRALVAELRRIDSSRQKRIRAQMRSLGFYISDVHRGGEGFTLSDFDALTRRGTIQVKPDGSEREAPSARPDGQTAMEKKQPMRDPERIPMILAALRREWSNGADQRLGQFLVNLVRAHGGGADETKRSLEQVLWSLEDGELLRWLGPESESEWRYVGTEPEQRRQGWDRPRD